MNVYFYLIYNSKEIGLIQIFINKRVYKENVVYVYDGILFNFIEK